MCVCLYKHTHTYIRLMIKTISDVSWADKNAAGDLKNFMFTVDQGRWKKLVDNLNSKCSCLYHSSYIFILLYILSFLVHINY